MRDGIFLFGRSQAEGKLQIVVKENTIVTKTAVALFFLQDMPIRSAVGNYLFAFRANESNGTFEVCRAIVYAL